MKKREIGAKKSLGKSCRYPRYWFLNTHRGSPDNLINHRATLRDAVRSFKALISFVGGYFFVVVPQRHHRNDEIRVYYSALVVTHTSGISLDSTTEY